MHLKRVTIQGFKSFARRTVFEFEPGITAVVGPNGSGKSNVSDAIRWALGEQNARVLRTKKQEDTIFGGSGGRSPAGMAEVIITLDNGERWLPIDFAEVEIGRRLYRDGSSEYLINGARARLKDVQDVLARADLGQNSYAIMGQGLVDQVLAMAPVERRRIIDEAAGIQPLRLRIGEARSRLDDTHANMDQVRIVLDEIEPRLVQLERQANRAREHAKVTAELQRLLAASFAARGREGREAIAAAQRTLEERNRLHEVARAELDRLAAHLDGLSAVIGERRNVVAAAAAQRREWEQRLSGIERQRVVQDEQCAVAERRIAAARAAIEEIEAEIARLDTEAPSTPDRPPIDASAIAREIIEVERRLGECEAEIAEVGAARRRREEQERLARRAGERYDAAARKLESLAAERDGIAGQRQELASNLRDFRTKRRSIRQQLSQADLRLTGSRRDADDARQRLRRLETEVRSVESDHADTTRTIGEFQARLDALRSVASSFEGVTTGTRAILRDGGQLDGESPAPEDQLDGVHGMLASLIRVPASLEAAISAALEHRLHAIVVDRADDAYAAIERLHRDAAGRAQFLPLQGIQHVQPVNLHTDEGIVGVAARLVRTLDKRYEPLIDTLLGRVIVCADLAAAQRMVGRGLGSVVTLDGTFLERHGEVSGGDHLAEAGLFASQREMDELPPKIDEARKKAEQLQIQLKEGRASVEQVRARAEAAEVEYEAARRDGDRLRAELTREQQRLLGLRRESGALRARFERLLEAAARAGEQARDAERQMVVPPVLTDLGSAEDLADERADLLAQLKDLRVAAAEAESERRAAEEAARRRAEALGRARQRLARAGDELQAAQEEAAAAQQRLEATEAALRELEADPVQSGEAVEAQRLELQQLEQQERQVHEQLRAAERASLDAEHRRLEAESNLERRQQQAAGLAAEMEREGFRIGEGGAVELLDAEPGTSLEPVDMDRAAIDSRIAALRRQVRSLGPVNAEAPEDYIALKERIELLTTQMQDLEATEERVVATIEELEVEITTRFVATFEQVDAALGRYFTEFFGGGSARMLMTDPDSPAETGIEIEATPPGKRLLSLPMLSGGERALTAVALLFALLTVNPAPFCVMDEVDAALDEANVGRFTATLKTLAERTQFLVVTHNRRTIETATSLYGITMGKDGVSSVLSLRLAEVASA